MSSHQQQDATLISKQAIDWFYRQSDGVVSPEQAQAFEQWLAVDSHAEEYRRIASVWSDMDALPLAQMLADVTLPESSVSRSRGSWYTRCLDYCRQRRWTTGWVLGTTAMLLLLAAWYVPIETEHLHTDKQAAGHGNTLILGDGSLVAANMDTQLTVRYTLLRRNVTLDRGEAFFEVAHNAWRPFTVTTPRASVRVTGTSFNVLSLSDVTEVAVRTGHVAVSSGHGKTASVVAGHMLAMTDRETTLLPGTQQAWSWREGMMVVSEVSLQDVMRKLQRYIKQPVQFNDQRAPGYRLSGTIDLTQPLQFIHALPALVPVHVLEKTDGTLMILSRK